MSYDLYFILRSRPMLPADFQNYFAGRANYHPEEQPGWYGNEETGVYFSFELSNGSSEEEDDFQHAAAFNINLYRPSYFILEAEPEVTAFVRHFELLVSDPQTQGMGDGEYNPDLLLTGWDYANEFGYSAILKDADVKKGVTSLPTSVLMRSWAWNLNRQRLQEQLEDLKFVPRVLFCLIAGRAATAAVWPEGIPIAVPEVDFVIVPRKKLAPRKLLKRVEDQTLVAYRNVLPLFEQHRAAGLPGLVLDYNDPPSDVAAFVEELPKSTLSIELVAPDKMLNRELVEAVA